MSDRLEVKICKKCNKEKAINEFYENKLWQEENYRDTWCKKCIEMLVIGEVSCALYFKQNKRFYPDRYWSKIYIKKEVGIDLTSKYRNFNIKEKRREAIKLTREEIFKQINNTKFYQFLDIDKNKNKEYKELKEYEEKEIIQDEIDHDRAEDLKSEKSMKSGKKYYSKKWHGYYCEDEIRYLEDYYLGLDNSFQLNNQSYQDYAKKVCKASLAMDNAFADMQIGVKDADKKYKTFKDIFDNLSQSAKFAEKTRTENDTTGIGSLGQLILKMENDGFLQKKVEFEDDDVDIVVREFKYILTAVGETF